MSTASKLCTAARTMRDEVTRLRFSPPVRFVYNPLEYAWAPHEAYIRRFGATPKRVVFLGMNPGPYGMAQTGVPFGEIGLVRDWLGIEAEVKAPAAQHPKRPVLGFACTRTEVSGKRLWGAIAQHFKTPAAFFENHYVANYCPLAFMEESGRNRTPDKLPKQEREPLFDACDRHLRALCCALQPAWVIGIGAFAERRAREALDCEVSARSLRIGSILHPSPANPRANQDWAAAVKIQLRASGLCRCVET